MNALPEARLVAGIGIDSDRYATRSAHTRKLTNPIGTSPYS
jgi:hypothetical protein